MSAVPTLAPMAFQSLSFQENPYLSSVSTMSEIQGGGPLTAFSMDICIPPLGTN